MCQLDYGVCVVFMTCSCAEADGNIFFPSYDYFDLPVGADPGLQSSMAGKEYESVVLGPSTRSVPGKVKQNQSVSSASVTAVSYTHLTLPTRRTV